MDLWLCPIKKSSWRIIKREGVFGVPKKVAGVIGRVKEKDLLVFHLLSKKRKGICGIGEVVSNPYEDNRNLWGRNRYPVRLQVVIIRNFAKERRELIPLSFLYDQNKNNGIIVEPVRALHYRLPVLGFRIGDFAYITDANYIPPEEKKKLKKLKILLICALRKKEHISHFALFQALEVINELQPEQAFLTHISHQLGLYSDVQKELPDRVSLSYDGMELQI